MTNNVSNRRYNILSRCLAALALMFVYVFSTSVFLVGASTTEVQARGGGGRGGGGGGRGGGGRGGGMRGGGMRGGGGRGRGGGGRGIGFVGPAIGLGLGVLGAGCHYSYRW